MNQFLLALAGSMIFSLPARAGIVPPHEPLDWAFRFATAIVSDEVDQAKAQEKVVLSYLALGNLEAAEKCADRISNWRQGTAWGEIAVAWADQGRTNEAIQAVRKAERVRRALHGDWQADRIGAQIARAYARQGNLLMTRGLGASLPQEEAIKTAAAAAYGMVKEGRVAEALASLAAAEGASQFDIIVGVADGYLELARHPGLAGDPQHRREALAGARRVLVKLPLLKRVQLAADIAEEYRRAGDEKTAQQVLEDMEVVVPPSRLEPLDKAPALAECGVVWVRLGEKERGLKLLGLARALAKTGDPMDQPAACAAVATCFARIGDTTATRQLCAEGLTIAAGFVNARPRALAIVEICRSMGQARLEMPEALRQQLTTLFNGLADPW